MAEQTSRRSFLGIMSIGLGAATLAMAGVVQGVYAFWFPPAPYEPSKKSKIGLPEEFPLGETRMLTLANENVFVFHDEEGIYAMSARCTHLGCAVQQKKDGFLCPCHGSKFDLNGKVLAGPAPMALRWLQVSATADGQILVDRGRFVDPVAGSKLKMTGRI